MSELMKRLLEGKERSRKHLAALAFAQKLAIAEKLRDRSIFLASNRPKLANPIVVTYGAMVAGGVVEPMQLGEQKEVSKPLTFRQLPGRWNIPRNSETLIAS